MTKLIIATTIIVIWTFALVFLIGMDNYAPTALFMAFQDPQEWGQLSMTVWLSGILGVGAVATTVIVGSFFGVGELATMSILAGVFFSYIPPMYTVFQQIRAMQGIPAELSFWLAMLFVSPLIIATIMSIIEWWSNRQ